MNDLANTKVGDRLQVNNGVYVEVCTVTRTTKTQVHCGSSKFNRRGREFHDLRGVTDMPSLQQTSRQPKSKKNMPALDW